MGALPEDEQVGQPDDDDINQRVPGADQAEEIDGGVGLGHRLGERSKRRSGSGLEEGAECADHHAQRPAQNGDVVHGDEQSASDTPPADKFPAPARQLAQRHGEGLLGEGAQAEFHHHDGHAHHEEGHKIRKIKSPASVLVGIGAKKNNIAQPDGGTAGRQDEPQLALPVLSRCRHLDVLFLSANYPFRSPKYNHNGPFFWHIKVFGWLFGAK